MPTPFIRRAGAIPHSEALSAMLVAIRAQSGISALPEISLVDLRAVEKHLGGFIPDDLLVLWLATGRAVGELSNLTRTVDAYYEAENVVGWRSRFHFAHVAFDETYSEEGFLCAALGRDAAPANASIVHWLFRKADAWPPTFETEGEAPILSYCRWKYPSVDVAAPLDPALSAALEPRIVGAAPTKERRVKHPKFGEGLVLETIPPDKLEIDFGASGVRKLLPSAVEDL